MHRKRSNIFILSASKKLLHLIFITISLLLVVNSVVAQTNTKYGTDALKKNTTGDGNSAFGYQSLYSNTSGNVNSANGNFSLYSNTTGGGNTASSIEVLKSNTTGYSNAANGFQAMYFNTTGAYNTATGVSALFSNTTGNYNTALGYAADVVSGNLTNATAIGYNAKVNGSNTMQLGNNSISKVYAGVGIKATLIAGGLQITGGTPAVGKVLTSDANGVATWQTVDTGMYNWSLTGNKGTVDGVNFIGTSDNVPFNIRVNNQKAGRIDPSLLNTFYGYQAGNSITTGSFNIANGSNALYSNTNGQYNNANGVDGLYFNTTGSFNTANGFKALYLNTTGNYNTALGHAAGVGSENLTNATAIGANALVNTSNTIQLGDNLITKIYAGVSNKAVLIAGGLQVTGGTPAVGKVLTSDANGVATWQTISGGEGMSGSGTVNYISKYTSNGTTLGNSLIFDNGTNIGIGTIAPAAKLDIVGKLKITDGTQGMGKILTSDANGLAAWATATPGPPGPQGVPGINGATWFTGSANPLSSTGNNNDLYLNTSTDSVFQKLNNKWQSIAYIKGTQGVQGAQGAAGVNGTNGATWITGSANPLSSAGNNSDLYLNTITDSVFEKLNGNWRPTAYIKGTQGEQGPQGNNGTNGMNGATWFTGSVNPSSSTGTNNDLYLNTNTDSVFQKLSNKWQTIAYIKGAQGEKGQQGEQGPKGDKGSKGDKGDTGSTGSSGSDGSCSTFTCTEAATAAGAAAGTAAAAAGAAAAAASATAAASSAGAAATAATTAGDAATVAGDAATEASTSASEASTSATNAGTSEKKASTSANNAEQSADQAKQSEDNAKQSEDQAKQSEDQAKQSEDNAKQSEDNAKQSEDKAKEYADAMTGDAGGDLSGKYPNPTVSKLQGNAIAFMLPNNNQILKWVNNAWTPSNIDIPNYAAGLGITISGDSISAKTTEALWNANKLQGKVISSTLPNNNQVLKWINNAWTPSNPDSLRLYKAGDGIIISNDSIIAKASDTLWNANKLQGFAVDATHPDTNQILTWNGSKWKAKNNASGWVVDFVNQDTANLYAAVTGNVGIGTKKPQGLFHVQAGITNNADSAFIINRNGNVGIGTLNPDKTYKLSVNGYIRAKKIVVETGWADYVFDKNYPLMPLQQVDKFIQQHNHLPNMPSAEQIQTKGLDLGTMQAKTMEKIEELTLYMIQLKKENEELKNKIAKLETLIKQ